MVLLCRRVYSAKKQYNMLLSQKSTKERINKMSLIDRIKFDGPTDGASWLIYKFPGEEFVFGTQLIVGQGQEALFVKGGEALDLFAPGTYTLHTENLPLLKKLVNMPFGGRTPFTAEVYYVNKTSRMDMNWGTATPFALEDPKYGIFIHIRCHGKYGVRIVDSRKFVSEIVGAVPSGTRLNYQVIASYFSGLLTSSIKGVVSAFMVRNKISFLEVTSYIRELSQECHRCAEEEFRKFGVSLVNFFIESITPPKEDYEKLKTYKDELAMGSDFYRQRRSFDILDTMASNQASGGLANAGIGLGMGLGMAPMAKELFSNINGNMNVSPAAQSSDMIVCSECGTKNNQGQKFCGGCGSSLQVGLTCSACGTLNPIGQRFCGECGTKLVNKCSSCGYENDLSQKFCGECGNKL